MLNRIYIIVGLLAIVVLAGAFIAPRFIQWGDYRDRMEELASGVLGADVVIHGDIEFSLLPQPRLSFTDVVVGAPDKPAATVGGVEAEFSLMEFLRDNYNVTRLVLRRPVIDLTVDESGLFGSGVTVATAGGSGVALGQASIIDGTVRLADMRAGENFVATDVDGELGLSSFTGPFQFQGGAVYRGERYSVRFNSSAVDMDGNARVTSFLAPASGAFSLASEGALASGIAPKFDGTITYRQAPPPAEAAQGIRGDMIFESRVQASTDRIVLSGYTLQPDENRAGTRLTGAASIQLGARQSFDAVISGGVFSLPPRDASEDASTQPYELVRLLGELPAPILPPLPGRIGVDLAEVGLRGFSLRNVRLDASSDGAAWTIEQFIAQLPGDTEMRANGRLEANEGRPGFGGQVSVTSERLDALAALWRKPDEDNPLFNLPGSLTAEVLLAGEALGLSRGALTLDEATHALDVRVGFGDEKRLDIVGHFTQLDAGDSAALGALLPDVGTGPGFGNSFPNGSFSLSSQTARLFGQDGQDLVAEGQWSPAQLRLTHLSAAELGGMGLEAALTLNGTVTAPVVSGSGVIKAPDPDAPVLTALYDLAGTPTGWREALGRSLPGEIIFDLAAANAEGGQILTLDGRLGAAALDFRAQLAGGFSKALASPLQLNGTLEAEDAPALIRQLGLGDAELFGGDGPMMVAVNLEGSPTNSLQSQITASLGDEFVSFAGNLLAVSTGEIHGTGVLEGDLMAATGLAQAIGARGLSLPPAEGRAELHFEGDRLARLTAIEGQSGETGFSGELSLSRTGPTAVVAGEMAIDRVDITGLAAAMFGPAALVAGDGPWPDGPIAIGEAPRSTRGTVAVSVPVVTAGGVPKLTGASFDLSWDETRTRLARFEAAIGAGRVTLDMAVCCAGPLVDKTVSGRLTLTGAAMDQVAPATVSDPLDGLLDAGLQFEGTGASIAAVLDALAGEGSFTIDDFIIGQFDPRVFPTVAGLDNVLEMDADALGAIIGLALGQGDFTAPTLTGAFTVAGGVGRLANLIVEGAGARLSGGANLSFDTLGLDGRFALTPLGFTDSNGLVGEDTSRIFTRLSGTLLAPVATLDLDTMVAAIQVRANEIEVDRLEVLRAEDAERQRAAAEERNRLIQEQRRRAAEEAARVAAEEAARLAEEEEARRLEEERLQQQQPPPAIPPAQQPTGPLDLSLPPQPSPVVNQPFFPPLN